MTGRLRVGLLLVGTNVVAFALGGGVVLLTDSRIDLTSARDGADSASGRVEEQRDLVVNVVRVCEGAFGADGRPYKLQLFGGCEGAAAFMKVNDHQEVTVRTSTGGSYTVSVPVATKVRVGQEWP